MSEPHFTELNRQMERVRQSGQAWAASVAAQMRAFREANPQLFPANAEPEPEESAPMTLTEFLLARIAEDEAGSRRLLRYAQENEMAVSDPQMLGRHVPGWHEWPDVQAMCSRVLAECEAKRRIVEQANFWGNQQEGRALDWVARLLAMPYADHPDYREEWKP